jgi:hypothetical protein
MNSEILIKCYQTLNKETLFVQNKLKLLKKIILFFMNITIIYN